MQFKPKGGSKPITAPAKPAKAERINPDHVFDPKKRKEEAANPRGGLVKAWSFSALETYEKCPHQTYLKSVKKIPQESSEPLERGNRIHKAIEDYIMGKVDILSSEVKHCHDVINELRKEYEKGIVIVEDEWAYDVEWADTDWLAVNAWCRMKLDAMKWESDTSARTVDWKSGRKFGNEFKHSQQGQLYAIGAFLRYPKLQHMLVEFQYVDQDDKLEKAYTREEAMLFLPSWTRRATAMTSATDFPAKPSTHTCKWCPYVNEHCEWGVK